MTSPTLPPPTVGVPAAPAPPPQLPTLPPPPTAGPTAPSTPAIPSNLPGLPLGLDADGAGGPPNSDPITPGTPHPRGRGRVRLVAALVGVVALAAAAWWFMGRSDGEPARSEPTPPAELLDADQGTAGGDSIGQIGVDAMEDATGVVDAINADRGEAELLAELGLDPTGEPLAGVPADVGHQFSWTFADGMSATIVVNTVSGDHSYTDSSGLSFRQVGELAFGRAAEDAPWTMIDASELTGVQRIGLDHPITTDDLVGGPVAAHLSVSGDGSLWSIDDDAFHRVDPAAREAWTAALGLPPTAPDGPITIWVSTAADGITVSSASIERGATGERVTYELNRRFTEPPVIEAPSL